MAGIRKELLERDLYDVSLEDMITMRKALAETVNRQMRRWNKAGLEGKGSAFTRYAQPYLRQYGRERFKTSNAPVAGRTESQQRRAEMKEINAMRRLVKAPTYSISGYKNIKKKALQGMARTAGIDLDSPEGKKFIDEMADSIVGSDQWGWLKRTIGSEAILEVSRQLAKGTATRQEVLERIAEMRGREAAGKNYKDMPLEDVYAELGFSEYANTEGEDFEL